MFIPTWLKSLHFTLPFRKSSGSIEALKNLRSANRSFAIVTDEATLAAGFSSLKNEFSEQERGTNFSWQRTWSGSKNPKVSQEYKCLSIKGKMFAAPLSPVPVKVTQGFDCRNSIRHS